MTDAPKLKPCPFCGSEDVDDWGECTWSRPVKWMYCVECHCRGPRVMMGRGESDEGWMQRTIAAWNTRHTPPEVQSLVDALRECRDELDEYSRQEYPLDHPVHERYRQRDYDANPARVALTKWEAMTNATTKT